VVATTDKQLAKKLLDECQPDSGSHGKTANCWDHSLSLSLSLSLSQWPFCGTSLFATYCAGGGHQAVCRFTSPFCPLSIFCPVLCERSFFVPSVRISDVVYDELVTLSARSIRFCYVRTYLPAAAACMSSYTCMFVRQLRTATDRVAQSRHMKAINTCLSEFIGRSVAALYSGVKEL
jgi:hypothetical protein